jgi:hypothetical protein
VLATALFRAYFGRILMNDIALAEAAGLPPSPRPAADDLTAIVERWWADHFPGSPVAAITAAWNHAFAAKEELKRRLKNSNWGNPNSEEH